MVSPRASREDSYWPGSPERSTGTYSGGGFSFKKRRSRSTFWGKGSGDARRKAKLASWRGRGIPRGEVVLGEL